MDYLSAKKDCLRLSLIVLAVLVYCSTLLVVVVMFFGLSLNLSLNFHLNNAAAGGTSFAFFNQTMLTATTMSVPAWFYRLGWTISFGCIGISLIYSILVYIKQQQQSSSSIKLIDSYFLILFTISNALLMLLVGIVWPQKKLAWSIMIDFNVILFVGLMFTILANNLRKNRTDLLLTKDGRCQLWLTRLLIQNALGFYLAWLIFIDRFYISAFLIQLNASPSSPSSSSSSTANNLLLLLLLLIFSMLAYSIMENTYWSKYLAYVFTPWLVFIGTAAVCCTNNINSNNSNKTTKILLILWLILSILLFIAKVNLFTIIKLNEKKLKRQRQIIHISQMLPFDINLKSYDFNSNNNTDNNQDHQDKRIQISYIN